MKTLFIISLYLISNFAFGQSPYVRFRGEYRDMLDHIPIDKGQEKDFFIYAEELFNKDSLKKAGQIFDRIYWLDTTSEIARKSNYYKSLIELRVINQIKQNLFNTWIWGWSGTNWGASETCLNSNKTKRIEISDKEIKFYRNDTLTRITYYTLTLRFDWVNGYLTNLIKYGDTKEDWYYRLNSFNGFTSDNLWIEQKSKYVCGNYGEGYALDKKNNSQH